MKLLQEDIPDGWRLASADEFEQNHSAAQSCMEDWAICQLTGETLCLSVTIHIVCILVVKILILMFLLRLPFADGKCDGMGYGGKAHRLTRQERDQNNRTIMGEVKV